MKKEIVDAESLLREANEDNSEEINEKKDIKEEKKEKSLSAEEKRKKALENQKSD